MRQYKEHKIRAFFLGNKEQIIVLFLFQFRFTFFYGRLQRPVLIATVSKLNRIPVCV